MADATENTPVTPEETIAPEAAPVEASAPAVEEAAQVTEEAQVESSAVEEAKPETPIAANESVSPAEKGGFKKLARLIVELLLVAAVVGLGLWGYGLMQKNNDLQKEVDTLNANPAIVEQKKTQELVAKVSALTEVPKGETPQAALVSDPAALQKQYPFFKDVQQGDQVLFYVNGGKVFVYRPSTNKIVISGPLTVNK